MSLSIKQEKNTFYRMEENALEGLFNSNKEWGDT